MCAPGVVPSITRREGVEWGWRGGKGFLPVGVCRRMFEPPCFSSSSCVRLSGHPAPRASFDLPFDRSHLRQSQILQFFWKTFRDTSQNNNTIALHARQPQPRAGSSLPPSLGRHAKKNNVGTLNTKKNTGTTGQTDDTTKQKQRKKQKREWE